MKLSLDFFFNKVVQLASVPWKSA